MCGFVAPPSKFGDPDVDMHKKLDLRQDQAPDGMDVSQLNADVNDADGDGLDDNTGEPVDDEQAGSMDQQPLLECPNCGYQAEAAHPTSISTADPQVGSDAAAEGDPDGPAEGDLCPACGKGLMESGTQLAEEGADPEADPNADVDDDAVVEEGRDPDDPSGPDDLDEDATRDAQDPEVDDGEDDADPEIDPDRLPMDAADDDDPDEDENAGDEEDDEDDKKQVKKSFPFSKK